jgi:LytS/YehU family sensor histidine kinase
LIGIIIVLIIRNKRKLKKQKEQFELINRITELELKVVKAQMNPHFISNCLAAIQELIYKNDVDKAGQYLAKFSYFLRQILNYSDKNHITISKEIEIIKLNVELEQLRFKNEFDFLLFVDENIEIEEVLIPALITQPFIENAIWHGLLPLNNSRNAQLKINIYLQNDLPIIEIEDNGVGRNLQKIAEENSKGTKLIVDKIDSLNRLYKTSNYKIEIIDLFNENKEQIGTKIKIQLDNI